MAIRIVFKVNDAASAVEDLRGFGFLNDERARLSFLIDKNSTQNPLFARQNAKVVSLMPTAKTT